MLTSKRRLKSSVRRLSILATVAALTVFAFTACFGDNPKDVKIEYKGEKRSADRISKHSLSGFSLVSNTGGHLFSVNWLFEDENGYDWELVRKIGTNDWESLGKYREITEHEFTRLENRPGTPEMFAITCEQVDTDPRSGITSTQPDRLRLSRIEADWTLTDISMETWGHLSEETQREVGIRDCGELAIGPQGDIFILNGSQIWKFTDSEPELVFDDLVRAAVLGPSCAPPFTGLDISASGEMLVYHGLFAFASCQGQDIHSGGVYKIRSTELEPALITTPRLEVREAMFGDGDSIYILVWDEGEPDNFTDPWTYRAYVAPPGETATQFMAHSGTDESIDAITVTPEGWIHMFYDSSGPVTPTVERLLSFRPLETDG